MCDDFRKASQTVHPLYYEYDGHWRPAGHEVVADVLYRELVPYVAAHDEDATPGAVSASTGAPSLP
jgi:hypothetical protein